MTEKDGEYFSVSPFFAVQDHEQILDVHNQYLNRCYQVMHALGGMSHPERVANMLVLNLNEESHRLVVEAHRQFIKTIGRISGQSKQNDRVVFWADTRLSLRGAS